MAVFKTKLSTLVELTFFSALHFLNGKPIYAGESTCLKIKMAAGFHAHNKEERCAQAEIKTLQERFLPF